MDFLLKSVDGGIATLVFNRPKVNAINEALTDEMIATLRSLIEDPQVKAIVLTGQEKFFSFGLDIPEFIEYSKDSFTDFCTRFAELYTIIFLCPKPVVAALNGHTVAGGCMIAIACDYRIMVSGKARIGLNEINFGSALFPGSTVMLAHCVGSRNAELIAYSGAMYSAEEAKNLSLIDEIASGDDLLVRATRVAGELAQKYAPAFQAIKMLLRKSAGEEMRRLDELHRDGNVDIWYSEHTWKQLQNIRIHT